jgi:alkylation response protein AidB-like acyl-CoA dehydrogenase
VLITEVPTREQLVEQAAELAPLLRENAAWARENRRQHESTIEALADAGIFRLRVPKRYGGYEADTRTLVEVGSALGRADGSASWVASVYWIPTWMAGMFPDEVQDEVFATPDVRICGTLSPSAMATAVDGGIVVQGKWGFISGALHSHWQEIIAMLPMPDGTPMPIVALVPMSDLKIVDDWHTSGLRGTGSVTTVAEDVFVPAARYLPLPQVLEGQTASPLNAELPMYRAPLLPVASASSVGTVLGLAQAAQQAFLQRLPGRKITYTSYQSQAEAPLTHLQVATASLKVDEAEFHAHRLADLVDRKCAEGSAWSMAERVRARADMGALGQLAKEAVGILSTASGGTSIYDGVPIQQLTLDMHAAGQHALMHPDTNTELYGRLLCGLPPNTLYV